MSYTTTAAVLGDGSSLGYGSVLAGPFVAYGEAKKITPAKRAVGKAKATNLQTLNATHEYLPTFIEPGEYELDLNLLRTVWTQIVGDVRKVQYFQLIIIDTADSASPTAVATSVFKGWIAGAEIGDIVADEIVGAKIKIQVTGAETWS